MRWLRSSIAKLEIAGELLSFMWQRRLWWMIPMIVVLLLFGLLVVFTQGTALAPFVYALF